MTKEWIGCSGCGSIWLGHLAVWEDDGCPYCDARGDSVGPVEGPSEVDQRVMDEMCANRTDAGDCPSSDAPTASGSAKMTLGDALEHLCHLVDMVEPEDTHYYTAMEVVSDAIEALYKE